MQSPDNNLPISGQRIVIVGLQPWDTPIGSNAKNIALEMARHNEVLYVNSPLDWNTLRKAGNDAAIEYRKQVMKGQHPHLQPIQQNLWQWFPDVTIASINFIKVNWLFDWLNRRNNRLIAQSIQGALQQLGWTDFLLFNDNDIFRGQHLPQLLQPRASMYYSRDNLVAVDYWRHHGLRLEPKTIANYSCCTANSSYLADYCRQHNPHSYDVGQGCELDIYLQENLPLPEDLKGMEGTMIGYTGYLTALRLDEAVLLHLARQPQQYQIVLVGPEDEAFQRSELHQLPNVHFLGSKPPESLPAYVQRFDLCINPQLVNPVTIGNYPRKVDEYLAMGKPVLATATKAMDFFAPYTYLCHSKEDYALQASRALQEHSAELAAGRRQFALSHSWENSVQAMYNAWRAAGFAG